MNQPLKQSVQNTLSQKQLSDKQLDQLNKLQSAFSEVQAQKPKPSTWPKIFAFASVMMFSFLLVQFAGVGSFNQDSLSQRIADELAANHLKLKPLEVTDNNLQSLSAYFTQLDFAPMNPATHPMSEETLLGARYCSIQGAGAIQLRLKSRLNGKIQSLYEAAFDKSVFSELPNVSEGELPVTVYSKGMKVEIWVEKGLVYGLVEKQAD